MFQTPLLILLLTFHLISFGQIKRDLNINHKRQGGIYARTSVQDTSALGGFATSDNAPKKIDESLPFSDEGIFLRLDTSQVVSFDDEYNGYKLYIGNKTDTILKLPASDSRLNVIAEVFFNKRWQPIEYLPVSDCGNSYHNVYLKQNEFWSFIVPKFYGENKVRLRYKLVIDSIKSVYSNEIMAPINKQQLKK